MQRQEPRKHFAVADLLNAAATPIKRSRPGSNSTKPSSSSPASTSANSTTPTSRPTASIPSRLKSSPLNNPGQSSPSVPATPFHLRPTPLAIQESLNGHLDLPTGSQASGTGSRIKLSTTMKLDKYDYRYMFERLMERSEVLDTAIDEAAETLMQYYGIEELGDPGVQSQEDIIAVGRLCSESDNIKLTETTSYLESSRMLGSGSRVRLQFENDMKVRGAPVGSGGVGLFPGCLVGVKGRNGGGKIFGVSEVFMMPPMDASYTKPSELLGYQYGTGARELGGSPLSVIVAAGPYTVDSDLDYEPLKVLLSLVAKERPDLLILLGPFVDSSHPLIAVGDVDETPSEIFRRQISRRLGDLLKESPRTTVILIPNARDLTSSHVAYPQSPFFTKDSELRLPKGVKCLPNPTTFSVNEVVFAITSVDVLFHLRNQELYRKCGEVVEEGASAEEDPSAKDMMARTCRHLLRQRSFYPIFPAPLPGKGIDAINLDITHNDLVKMGSRNADVVILPSLLKHFSKIVDSTIMLNPSFLVRGNAAGTFARLTIHPMEKDELERRTGEGMDGEGDERIEHRVWERCRVDVIKV